MRVNIRSSSDKPAGRGCATVFGAFFALMGLAFVVGIAWIFFNQLRPYFWEKIPCTILESRVVEAKDGRDSDKPHEVQVRYRFEVDGHRHEASRVRISGAKFETSRDARRLQRQFRVGEASTCYVNGDSPPQSVLKRDALWVGLAVLMPLVFVIIGVAVIIGVWRDKPEAETALSQRLGPQTSRGGVWFIRLFGSVFFLAGSAFFYISSVRPWLELRASANWVETPCTFLGSEFVGASGPERTTIGHQPRYEYFFAGEKRIGDRYNFDPENSCCGEWGARARNEYATGRRKAVCFVDPAEPDESVLVRDLGPDKWAKLFPLLFVIVGLAIMLGASRMVHKKAPASPTALPAIEPETASLTGPGGMVELPTSEKRVGTFIGVTIFALFWNTFVWCIYLFSKPPSGVKLFLGIFLVVGVVIALAAVGAFLAIFNPQPSVFASGRRVSPGGGLDLQYRFRGNVRRLKRLRIVLRGEEQATYQRGSSTTTDKHTFHEIPLVDTTERTAMTQGSARIEIPADAMHSFDATNNKIVWAIHVRAEIGLWPKVQAEFPIVVLPRPTSTHA